MSIWALLWCRLLSGCLLPRCRTKELCPPKPPCARGAGGALPHGRPPHHRGPQHHHLQHRPHVWWWGQQHSTLRYRVWALEEREGRAGPSLKPQKAAGTRSVREVRQAWEHMLCPNWPLTQNVRPQLPLCLMHKPHPNSL